MNHLQNDANVTKFIFTPRSINSIDIKTFITFFSNSEPISPKINIISPTAR